MRKIKKKVFSLLLAFMTAFSMLPMNVVNAAGLADLYIHNVTIPKKITNDEINLKRIGLYDSYHASDPWYNPSPQLNINDTQGITYKGYIEGNAMIPLKINGVSYKPISEDDLTKTNINFYYILTIPAQSFPKNEITVSINNVNFTGYKGESGYYVIVNLGKLDSNNNLSGGDIKSDTWTYSVSNNVITATCDASCGTQETTKLTLNASGGTYTGNEYAATLDNSSNFKTNTGAQIGKVQYYDKNTSSLTNSNNGASTEGGAPRDVGEYTAKVSINDEDGKLVGTISKDFNITKATPNLEINITDWIYGQYNSDKNGPTIRGDVDSKDVTYLYKKLEESDTQYKTISTNDLNSLSAGEYSIKANVAATKNYTAAETNVTTFKVEKADIEGVNIAGYEGEYDGKEHDALTVEIPNGATIKYGTEEGKYDLNECPKYKDAQEKYIYYQVTLDDNHTPVTGKEKVYIKRKEVTVNGVTANDKEYDGTNEAELNTSNATIEGVLTGEKVTVIASGKGSFETSSAKTQNVNYSSNDLILMGDDANNYIIPTNSQFKTTATISPRKVELEWNQNTQFTYDANEHTIDAKVTNIAINEDQFNIQYENNSSINVGTYTAKVISLGNDNYTLDGVENVTKKWSINYLTVGDDVIATTNKESDGTNGWYTSDVEINAPNGYLVSKDGQTWQETLTVESDCNGFSYYLRDKSNSQITDKKTLNLKVDKTLPTGTITIKENKFTTFLKLITFGYFFKDNADVTIDASDTASGIAKVEYQVVGKNETYTDDKWIEEKTLSLPANGKYVVYVKITDKAGNEQIINSDGVVVYTDATSESNVTYTKTDTKDVTTGIQVNGNTIREVKNKNGYSLNKSFYTVNDKGFVVLKNECIKDLPVGEYTYTISYYLLDENYDNHKGNSEEPYTSTINLTVQHKDAKLTVKEVEAKNYLDDSFTLDVSHLGTGKVSYSSDDTDVATVDENGKVSLHSAGVAKITVSLTDDGNYAATSKTITIAVNPIDHNIQVKDKVEKTYGDELFDLNAESDDKTSDLEYLSNDKKVATVDEDGKVTLHNAGKAIITVKQGKTRNYNETTKEVEVNVLPKNVTVTAENKEKVYGSKDEELTYTNTELIGKDQLTGLNVSRTEGEAAGTYDITVSQNEGANPNYNIIFVKGIYTVKPFEAKNINVKLDNTLAYNGEKQEQLVKEVTLDDGTVIPSDGYAVEGNVATEPGTYTLTIKGKGNYTGEYKVTYVVVPTKESQLKEDENGYIEIGNGKLSIVADTEENNLNAKLETSKSDIINMLVEKGQITADDLSKVANGAKLDIILKVKVSQEENNSKEAKQTFEKAITNYKVGKLLNITLVKRITENGITKEEQIYELQNKIKVSINVPKELINKDTKIKRNYSIARNHDGKVENLKGIYDEQTHKYTFETDKFSDYAILYQDAKVESTTTMKASNERHTKTTVKSKKVKTGDDIFVEGYAFLLVVSLVIMTFLRKEENN